MAGREVIEANNFTQDDGLLAYDLEIHRGWDFDLAYELVEHSKESEIIQATPRDMRERFSGIESAFYWHDEHPGDRGPKMIYSLWHAAELAGAIWFSQKHFGSADRTFAIRMYESVRGLHLAKPFAQAVHFDHEIVQEYDGDTWLETNIDNRPARGLFPQLHYKPVEALDIGENRVRMMRLGIATKLARSIRPL